MPDNRPSVAILGAGPSGLALARRLADLGGVDVTIFEQSDRVGGLHHSVGFDGDHFDTGTFLFNSRHGMLETFPELAHEFVQVAYRPRSITPTGSFDKYPFSPSGYVRDHGPLAAARVVPELLWSKLRYRRKDSVAAFARYYMSDTVYRQSGLRDYVCRLNDADDSELDVLFAELRMAPIAHNGFRKIVTRKLPSRDKKRPLKLADRLVRPQEGMPYLYGKMRDDVSERGVNILFDQKITAISATSEGFTVVANGITSTHDRVVSTIPVPAALQLIGAEARSSFPTRNLISLFYRGDFVPDAPVLFNFTTAGMWKRITVFSKFYGPGADGRDYLTAEVTVQGEDPADVETARRDFEAHMATHGVLAKPVYLGAELTKNAYPLYLKDSLPEMEADKQVLIDFGIDVLGRQGNFEYVISNVSARRAAKLAQQMFPTAAQGTG